jgi:serine protease
VVIVAAAGNQARCQPFYPASYPGVLSVSAVGITKARASYSNVGPFIKVAAPGGDFSPEVNGNGGAGVLSTVATNLEGNLQPGYAFYTGTSMATAHMSGVVALMRSANPALTPLDIDNLLVSGALTEDLGQLGRDNNYGYGLIDAHQAVVAAVNTPGGQPITPVPILVVTPLMVNFGTETSSITLTVSNGGGRTLMVNPPSENSGGWLRISAAVDSNGLGNYSLLADRANLPDGYYCANVTFTSNANSIQIPVTLQVADNSFDSIGIHELKISCDGQ